ncbi:cellulose synthase [Prosthecomicrobium pneumaticum]|uniref:Tetratricopeptide (TPR) repeat protein n=1 Tax=Prosthecomicrobium pneumaticum TaxID=81895 RepID=A0A7W9CVK8_9HYPH|nr:cellulose synthase [Prosthecomicrobium pneumaticum]MBB5752371.1 tetratricopeptide (TPR) repeat protein [Prosthecomicrobium pneumaticum]
MPVTRRPLALALASAVCGGALALYLEHGEPAAVSPARAALGETQPIVTASLRGSLPPVIMAQATIAPAPSAANPPVAPSPPAPDEPAAPSAEPAVDETALRYFARNGDQERLAREIARLRALYPDWVPPDDLTSPAPIRDAELDRMWRLYGEQRYAEVRAAIAARQTRDPQWQPPADLLTRLDVAEARERLVNASDNQQWNTVVTVAAATPSLLTCAEIDVLWRVAEAFAKTDRTGRARDVYTYVLRNCQEPAERLATVQKALPLLSEAEFAGLLALERRGPDGKGEFEAVRDDIARRGLSRAATDPTLTVSDADRERVETLARAETAPDDAILLGWYFFRRSQPDEALRWFEIARTKGDNAEIGRGRALTLNALKRPADAEAAAAPFRDAGDDNRAAYLIAAASLLALEPPTRLAPDVMSRMASAVTAAKDAPGAEEFGWYAYRIGQTRAAAQWFETALGWQADAEPAAFGLALARQKLGDRAGLASIVAAWSVRSPRIAELGGGRAARRAAPPAAVARPAPDAPEEEAAFAAAEPPAPATPRAAPAAPAARGSCGGRGALDRGWCLLDLDRPIEAADAFAAAGAAGGETTRRDAAYGKSLAYLRAGLTDLAATAAAEAPQSAGRRSELSAAILAQRAIGAYNDGRYVETLFHLDARAEVAAERNDLLMMRGWSYFHLRRLDEAKRIFVALASTGSRDAQRALAAIRDQTRPR